MSKTPGRGFGAWLREQMDRRGYSGRGGSTRLARDAGINLSIVSRALNDEVVPALDALRGIGKALGYTLGEMMVFAGVATPDELPIRRESPDEASAPVEPSPYTDPHERQLWEMRDLPERVRRHVIISLRAALRAEEEEDPRPNADVKQFRKTS
ncbi:helix-turn-helix domain-containing protein [Nonomuraea turcica]|uniref:helix-turn-helix domain-containing protein n=1 Tax=Nonomuraea sp. G32 TaxID=3067274 RepID=UPI00273CD2DB|nr:helix-turn-helix transcriptional regulator [Nonomuraea sp. G32]MDP4500997.1 helix-turn-helix transcriptional regulator [Nonomuraea sp. G32]